MINLKLECDLYMIIIYNIDTTYENKCQILKFFLTLHSNYKFINSM